MSVLASGGAGNAPPGETASRSAIPRLVCISTDVNASAALQATVASIVPEASVEAADTSLVRSAPEADCVIIAAGRLYTIAYALVRELRARGYDGALILVLEQPALAPREALARLGAPVILAEPTFALQLPGALLGLVADEARRRSSPRAATLMASLHRLQATLAMGEVASELQHALNNPLAALLAEAQLLELEPMASEHLASIRRIIELCRRVIDVSRSLEGMSGGQDS